MENKQSIYLGDGSTIPYTAQTDIKGGDVVILATATTSNKMGGMCGVATADIKAGEEGTLIIRGVFEVRCNDIAGMNIGKNVVWNAQSRMHGVYMPDNPPDDDYDDGYVAYFGVLVSDRYEMNGKVYARVLLNP